MKNILDKLIDILSKEERYVSDGHLLKNVIVEAALSLDPTFLKLLLKDEEIKNTFFQKVDTTLVFDKIKFQRFISNKQFLPDSYTEFNNKIGLTDESGFISKSENVVLSWAYKDCVLEGGQSKEEAKRTEIFWNETLAPDQIDRLLSPKVLSNFRKFSENGEEQVTSNSDSDNLLIRGNNLLVLHTLNKKFKKSIKLIYIDPPYNTGNDGFGYNDSFNQSTWLTFMKNRLSVAKELLREDGSIFISIDQNEVGHLIVLMNEIFGQENQKNIVTVKRSSVSGAKVINPGVVNVSEFLLIYSKNSNQWKPNKTFREKDRDTRYNNFIKNIDSNPENWEYIPVLEAFSEHLGIKKSQIKKHFGESYELELEKFYFDNKEKIIRFAGLDESSVSDKVKQLKKISKADDTKTYILEREGKSTYYLYKGDAILFFKDRLIQVDGKDVFGEMISDIWDDVLPNDIHNEGGVTLRKGKKPEKFIHRIIELGSTEGDIVLDFHLGSGTTAAVAHKMGRRYIGIEQLDYGKNDALERLKNVISGDQTGVSKNLEWNKGGSFIACELLKLNENYIEKIIQSASTKELIYLWKEIQEKAFISYKINPQNFDQNIDQFENLQFEDQKRFLIEVLDKNMLYVPLSEIDDQSYKVSQEDKTLNAQFFGSSK
jgi:adenine-specific DNA-methyltransferase